MATKVPSKTKMEKKSLSNINEKQKPKNVVSAPQKDKNDKNAKHGFASVSKQKVMLRKMEKETREEFTAIEEKNR